MSRDIPGIRVAIMLIGLMILAAPILAQEPTRSIVKVAGDLYRFQENAHYSVFLVTPDGIIVTDPINPETAKWLKSELKQRFDKPVKYVIYSHHHEDHIAGGEIFSATATFVAHEKTLRAIVAENIATALPDITFSDEMTVKLGGKIVELTYMGISHTNNSIAMFFPDENAVYAVDFVCVKALPFQDLPDYAYHYPQWLESLQKLEKMEFDILLPGHDDIGDHSDVRLFRHYLEDLETAVAAGIAAGASVDELQETVTMDDYREWALYTEWRALNVKGMHHFLTQ
jgi:glyoxylase-like metal-dependent hydrolase (beta-lactamase superfamily II)